MLVAGVSVRMLAQSAGRAGIRPVSLDWFADTDTAESSLICQDVSGGTGFDADRLLAAAERYAPAGAGAALIYSGGFDSDPELLSRLARGRALWGNTPDTLRLIKSPSDFFRRLDRLGIPYPETRWSLSDERGEPGAWLIKQASSEGGAGVRLAGPAAAASSDSAYLQRRLDGHARSALFLANGREAQIIGFNTLWVSDHDPQRPYLFAGARTERGLNRQQRAAARDAVVALTREFLLRGINSLDFMVVEDEIRVLEINPRPSATMALYDADDPDGLVSRHIDACRGRPIRPTRQASVSRAFKILYTRRAISVPVGIPWPAWCTDRPRAGVSIAAGRPVCGIQAEDGDAARLDEQLFVRERIIGSLLML